MCNEAARRTALGLMREDFAQLKIPLRFPEGLPNLGEAPSIRITDTTVIVRAVRPAEPDGAVEMVQRRWSWAGAASARGAGKPVYNYRSEGRDFRNSAAQGRCLIPLDGFYEFTEAAAGAAPALPFAGGGEQAVGAALALLLAGRGERAPPPSPGGAGKRRKDKWLFTLAPDTAGWNPAGRAAPGLFCVAGLWRSGVEVGSRTTGPATAEAFTMLTCDPGPDIAPYHSRQIVLMPRDRWADWLGGVVSAAEMIAPTPGGTLAVAAAR